MVWFCFNRFQLAYAVIYNTNYICFLKLLSMYLGLGFLSLHVLLRQCLTNDKLIILRTCFRNVNYVLRFHSIFAKFSFQKSNIFKTKYNYIMEVETHLVDTIGPTKFYCFWVWQLVHIDSKYVPSCKTQHIKTETNIISHNALSNAWSNSF